MLLKIKSFLLETLKLLMHNPRSFNAFHLVRHLPDWWSSLSPQRNPLADGKPWIAFAAADFLRQVLNKEMTVYEYGSGGSTLFFARHAKEVISTEHDREWHRQVVDRIGSLGIDNCKVRLFEPSTKDFVEGAKTSDPAGYVSDDERYFGRSFKSYASSIDEFPDGFFDVIVVDGRARPSCFWHAEVKLKKGGYLVLDNAETPYYHYIHSTLKEAKWRKRDFYGLFPYIHHFSQTCIWKKP